MSQANGTVHQLSNGRQKFNAEAGEFEIPVLETLEEFRAIAGRLSKEPGKTDADCLAEIIGYISDHTQILLSPSEADHLRDTLEILYAETKKKRADAILATLPSQRSIPA